MDKRTQLCFHRISHLVYSRQLMGQDFAFFHWFIGEIWFIRETTIPQIRRYSCLKLKLRSLSVCMLLSQLRPRPLYTPVRVRAMWRQIQTQLSSLSAGKFGSFAGNATFPWSKNEEQRRKRSWEDIVEYSRRKSLMISLVKKSTTLSFNSPTLSNNIWILIPN